MYRERESKTPFISPLVTEPLCGVSDPPQAKLAILLVTLLVSCYCYAVMERRLANKMPFRLPRIPRPRHKVSAPSPRSLPLSPVRWGRLVVEENHNRDYLGQY